MFLRIPFPIGLVVVVTSLVPAVAGNSPQQLSLFSPVPHQVLQRQGYDPRQSHVHAVGTPDWGAAEVLLRCRYETPSDGDTVFEARTTLFGGCRGRALDWTAVEMQLQDDQIWQGKLRVPAGGWYRFEVRLRRGEQTLQSATVEPIGVGEVLLVAGQSYAAGANDELLKIDDPAVRAAAWQADTGDWRPAHDPQPNVGDGGTIWPAMVDELLPWWQVPIGLVNVAVGATTVEQWQPGGKLHDRLVAAGKAVGSFRAVLWQQGESDVHQETGSEDYAARLERVRAAAADAWQSAPVWLLAKSTLHPTLYNNPAGEAQIRTAVDRLCQRPGFLPGPDTDLLDGDNRGDIRSRRHLTGQGQRRAGRMWAGSLAANLPNAPVAEAGRHAWQVHKTVEGTRFATLGPPPAQPAPTLFVFALGIEDMQAHSVYSQTARQLASEGWLCVTLDPPCHGEDQRPGEPAGLAGWRARVEQGQPLLDDFFLRCEQTRNHLVLEGCCDPLRVAVSGTSRGGFCALHWARRHAGIRAAAVFAPVTDLAALDEFLDIQVAPGVQALALANYADDLADRRLWLTIGNRDQRVDTARTVQFCRAVVEAAARRGLPEGQAAQVELSLTPTAGHAVAEDAYRRAAGWLQTQFSAE